MLLDHQPLLGDLLNPSCWGVYLPGGVVGNFMLICHPWLVIHMLHVPKWYQHHIISELFVLMPQPSRKCRVNKDQLKCQFHRECNDKSCDVVPQIFRYQSHVLRGTNPPPTPRTPVFVALPVWAQPEAERNLTARNPKPQPKQIKSRQTKHASAM